VAIEVAGFGFPYTLAAVVVVAYRMDSVGLDPG